MAVDLTEDRTPEGGGESQLMPFLGPCTSVPPKLCTLAFLKPDVILHRGRPVFSHRRKARYCFTMWFDGRLTSSDDDLFLKAQHLYKGAVPFLRRSAVQRILSRAVCEAGHAESLADCFGADTAAFPVSPQEHHAPLRPLFKHEKLRAFLTVLAERRGGLGSERGERVKMGMGAVEEMNDTFS
ncbi:hypothetical protein GH5_01372 [Leishmania sp. Ghana 2012 LV757]|uniref:hypothetical protein n=1 Tax=Leishmania sp. Ghana 2012 LV757 TaxID=2803181 RepID=UPI001B3DB5E4|nr:hypothetical protein GH5_01372 [Leishmania sp. Ghana 2012 LV757]